MPIVIKGRHTIKCKATNTVLEATQSGKKLAHGASLRGTASQQWVIEDVGDDWYTFRSVQGPWLGIPNKSRSGGITPGAQVATDVPGATQRWRIEEDDDDDSFFIIKPENPQDFALEMSSSSTPVISKTNGSSKQLWAITFTDYPEPFNPDLYPFDLDTGVVLVNYGTKTIANVDPKDKDKEASVVAGNPAPGFGQIWIAQVRSKENNLYYIKNGVQKVLGFTAPARPGLPVYVHPEDRKGVVWEIRPDSKNWELLTIRVPNTDYLIEVAGGNDGEDINLVLNETKGPNLRPAPHQLWTFERI